jgi:arylsulfatase A-like enzyme
MRVVRFFVLICICIIGIVSCRNKTNDAPAVIHLTQMYKPEFVQDRVKPTTQADHSPNLWKFTSGTKFVYETFGVIQPGLAETGLSGKAKDDFPLVHLERKVDPGDSDRLHSIEIRMKASAGKNLQVFFDSGEKTDLNELRERSRNTPFRIETPLLAGDTMQTYKLSSPRSDSSSEIRQVFVRVTDAAGADFEMESVRLIFRKEYLAGIPSGASWQGLSEIYHDTLVSRAPEKIRIPVRLPSAAWLDLSLGTLDNSPVQFVVSISGGKEKSETLLKRTVTRSQAWESAPVDLSRYGNQEVTLTLQAGAEEDGQIAFWGSPVIRSNASWKASARNNESKMKRPQGLILIWADTLRSDHLDLYGYHRETAPHLKQMAAEGAVFSEHMVQGTWTKVSTPSLLTGLYPSSHGVHDFTDRIPASAETLTEIFQKQGYATVHYSSVLFTGKFTNLHQGFDELHEDTSLPDQRSSKTARVYVDRLIPWLETHRNVPFFVFLHITDPHDPYRSYPPYDTMWADPSKTEEHENNAMKVREAIQDPLLKRFGMPTRAELIQASIDPGEYLKQEIDWYDGSIRGMDAEVRRLLDRLEELKLDRDTLIVFVGDHGEEFHEHGRMFHGQSVYRELARTPLIFRQPGVIPEKIVVNETVESIDVMPTILEVFGFSTSQPVQGRSLLPFMLQGKSRSNVAHADEQSGNTAIVEKAATSQSGGPPPRETESVAIILDGWKLIHNTKRASGAAEYELYAVASDPREQKNLAAEKPEIVRRLLTEISRWRKITASQKLKSDAEATKGMSQEELERLRSLGYIQ